MLKSKRHGKSATNISVYLHARGSTFSFIMFFITGLVCGSAFCVSGTDGADIIRAIIGGELTMQLERSFTQLVLNSIAGFAGIFIFAYLCVNCRKGALLIYVIPLIHGLSAGSFITVTLYSYGFSAFNYIVICFFIPKFIETLLLLSLCNKSARYCKEQFAGQPVRHRDSFPIWLYMVLFGLYFIIESLFIYGFRWLLL